MNLDSFVDMCRSREPVAIVLTPEDYTQLELAIPSTPGEWDRQAMKFRGAPILRGHLWKHSYIVEDTPDGPLIHAVP